MKGIFCQKRKNVLPVPEKTRGVAEPPLCVLVRWLSYQQHLFSRAAVTCSQLDEIYTSREALTCIIPAVPSDR
jgi:hypothetical protein